MELISHIRDVNEKIMDKEIEEKLLLVSLDKD